MLNNARRSSRAVAVATLGIAMVVTAGCNAPGGTEDDGTVHVGLLGNLTGDAAPSFGLPFRNGLEMALAEASDALDEAGVEIDLVAEDARSEVAAAVTGYNKLKQENVPVVINDSQSPLGQAVAPLANDDEIAFLTGAGSEVENPDGYAFRFTDLGTPTQGVGDFLAAKHAERVGVVIASDNPSFATLADATEAGLPDGFSSRQEVASADTDFSAVIANLRKDDVDAVVLSVLPAQAGNLLLQMDQAGGFDDVVKVGTVAISNETHTVAQDASAGFSFPQVWAPGQSSSVEFEKAYREEYDEVPTAYGALGYQVGWILAAAVIAAHEDGDVTGTSIRDALPAASTSDLVTEHGVLDLALSAEGAATSTGVMASFADDGTMRVTEE